MVFWKPCDGGQVRDSGVRQQGNVTDLLRAQQHDGPEKHRQRPKAQHETYDVTVATHAMYEMTIGCEARQTCTLNTGMAGSEAWEGRRRGSKVEGSNAQAEHTEARPQPLYCRQNRPAPSHQGTLNRDSEHPLLVLLIHNGEEMTRSMFFCCLFA